MRYMLRAILVLGLAVPLYAATHFVDVGPGLAFSPAFLLVAPGDTVTWVAR